MALALYIIPAFICYSYRPSRSQVDSFLKVFKVNGVILSLEISPYESLQTHYKVM